MRSSSLLAVLVLAFMQSVLAGITLPRLTSPAQILGRAVGSMNTQIQEELRAIISNDSIIIAPDDSSWFNETERYMQNVRPQVQLSVLPSQEDDVGKIVQYANSHDISFFAVSRGHALTASVSLFNGIEIDMRNLNGIRINSDNVTARFQGGVYSDGVIKNLWNQGYVTATGTCSCVSVLGPALGGGHGWQQGKHGLTMDHFVNLNVVLANGTSVSVNESSDTDLWWAMRGAGHNFGIVTSFESKIWPDNFKTYFVKIYQFSGDSLEALFEQVNRFQGNGTLDPTWLGSYGLITVNTTLSETKAIISWTFLYDGAAEAAEVALQPFEQLSPLSTKTTTTQYNTINDQTGGMVNGSLCAPNKTHIIGTAHMQTYNTTTMRAIYDLYNQKISLHPELNKTRVLLENYAVQGVRSFDSDDSAFPFRDEYILTKFDARLPTSNPDASLLSFATEWRDQTVDLWNAGQPERKATTYVNYAAGYESLEARYGHETWRLERLRALKAKYDPENRFAWYNPIVEPEGES